MTGHTDAKGNAASNLKLSRERAAAVVQSLESRGVSPEVLKSKGLGLQKLMCLQQLLMPRGWRTERLQ